MQNDYFLFSIGVIFASYCWARAFRSDASRIFEKNSSMTLPASTDAHPGAAGVSLEFDDEAIRAFANWSSPSESTYLLFAGPRPFLPSISW